LRNRCALAAIWTNVLLLPALQVLFKAPYVHHAFSRSASLKCLVCLCLGITFFSDCDSDKQSLSCPCTKRNTKGLASCLCWNTDLRMDDLCPFAVLSSPKEIRFTATLYIFQITRENSIILQELDLPGIQKKANLKDCSIRNDYIYILLETRKISFYVNSQK